MYGTRFIIKATNLLNEYYEITLDYLDYAGSGTELKAAKQFLQLTSTNGDENRLEPILGTQARIRIYVDETDTITIADLIATHDSDIKVTVTRIDLATAEEFIQFQGFVVVEDNKQPFLDPPFELEINCLDGIGLLKGVDLVDTTGIPFNGSQTIIQWIGQILYKTNQDIPVRVYFNFFPLNFVEISALAEITLNAVTFRTGTLAASTDPTVDVNAANADDCFTALEKIIRCLRCRLFFEDGRFMIVNLQEYANPNYNFTEYTFGTPTSGIVPMNPIDSGTKTYNSSVGKAEIIYPVLKDALLYLKLAYKYVKLNYNYDQSLNKICNQDFKQGDADPTYDEIINSSIVDPSISPPVDLQTRAFDLYCWDHFNSNNMSPGVIPFFYPYPSTAPTAGAFIRSVQDTLNYEIMRFLVIQDSGNVDSTTSFVRSSSFLVDSNDILQVSFEWRTRNSVPSTIFTVGFLYLTATDGTFYAYRHQNNPGFPNGWIQTDSNFIDSEPPGQHPNIIGAPVNGGLDWFLVDVNQIIAGIQDALIPTPKSGSVQLLLINFASNGGNEYWFKNINMTITPFLQGSFVPLKGDYNLSLSTENIKQSDTETVEISDSPKRYFKGALLAPDGVTLIPASWHRRGQDEHFRFTQAMERTMYNLLSRQVYKIEGTFKGLVYLDNDDFTVARPIGYLNSYFFVDGNFPTKKFIQTSFDIDVYSGEGRRVFVEVLRDSNDDGWSSPDVYKFDYIFQ